MNSRVYFKTVAVSIYDQSFMASTFENGLYCGLRWVRQLIQKCLSINYLIPFFLF